MLTDPIADMLNRIRNAIVAKQEVVPVPASKTKIAIAEVLRQEGFIKEFEVVSEGVKRTIRLRLAYGGRKEPTISGLRRVSKPGLRSTSRSGRSPRLRRAGHRHPLDADGVMTGQEAWRHRVGARSRMSGRTRSVAHRSNAHRAAAEVEVRIEGRGYGGASRRAEPRLLAGHGYRLGDGRSRCRPSDRPQHRSLHGLTRSLLANMVTGVSDGFTKVLELQGVGYRAQMQGAKLVLQVGYSKPVEVEPPEGITFVVEGTNRVLVQGINRELVGQVAADVRFVRPPEPYKGKGIRYQGERVRRKAGKAGKAGKR
jgi:large subunit ribosomal protein L6